QAESLSLDAPMDEKGSIDFSFDAPAAAAPAEETPAAGDGGLDFDLGTDVSSGAQATPPAEPSLADAGETLESLELGSAADNLIDFESPSQDAGAQAGEDSGSTAETTEDLGEDEIKWEMDTPVEEAAAAESNDAGGDFDEGNGNWDETATKLDLARAYIDMGDAEGARNILEEVMAEGNEQQKQQAAELASQIA